MSEKSGKKSIEQAVEESASGFRDSEIEYQLIAYLIRSNPVAAVDIQEEWFADELLKDVFKVVRDLRITMSSAMVLNELKDRKLMNDKERPLFEEALDQVYELNVAQITDKTARHMMTQIMRLSESRMVLNACGKVISSMRNFDLDEAKTILAGVSRKSMLTDSENSAYYLDHYERRLDVMSEREELMAESEDGTAGIKTGIPHFDRLTGGLLRKEFGIIAGVTGVGKTAALLEFGANAYEEGYNVMIGSGEMSLDELAFRLDSRLTRIHGNKFRQAKLSDDDYRTWENTMKMYRAYHDNVLFLSSYPRDFSIEDFERDMLRVEEETGKRVDMVCLDYINIMNPIVRSKGDWKDQSNAVWDFKGFCADHNVVGWSASQVVDDAYDKELYDASDLKYARAISEAAPVISAIIQTDRDRVDGRMKLQVIKMRSGALPKKPIRLNPNLGIMRLHETLTSVRSLADIQSPTIDDVERKARKSRPKRKPNGR
jgi:replicative DNA helicase